MRRLLLAIAALAGVLLHTGVAQAAPVLHLSGWKASAGKPETFTITRVGGNGPATIAFKTSDGSATTPLDYTATSLTISWARSQTTATVTVPTFVNLAKAGRNISFTASITSNGATSSATGLIVEPPAPAPAPAPPPVVTWVFCALQGNPCTVNGTANVRYGDPDLGLWTPSKSVTGSIFCDSSVFGDPKPGDVDKSCQTDGTVAAPGPAPTPTPVPIPTPVPSPVPAPAPNQCDASHLCHVSGVATPIPAGWITAPLVKGGYARPLSWLWCAGSIVRIEALDANAFINDMPTSAFASFGDRLWAVHFVDGPCADSHWTVAFWGHDLEGIAPGP